MTLQPQSLRIGNYYVTYSGKIEQVDLRFFNLLYSGATVDELVKEPIPLTEDILLRLGFEKYDWMDGFFIKCLGKHLMIQFYKNSVYVWLTKVTKDSQGHKMSQRQEFMKRDSITTVHDLQNFYFALEKTELTFKDK